MTKYELQDRIRNILFVVWISFLVGIVGFYAVVEYLNYRAVKRVEALILEERKQKALEAKIRAAKRQQEYDANSCMAQQAMIEKAQKEKKKGKKKAPEPQLPTRQEIIEAINAHLSPPAYPSVKLNDSTSITIQMRQ